MIQPVFQGLVRNALDSSVETSLEKHAATLQNDAVIAILIVTGRKLVIWKADVELCRVVGSKSAGKTRIRRKHAWKAKKKWCLGLSRPCVSDQTLKQGSNLFTIGGTRVSGFCLKGSGTLSSRVCWKFHFFYQCRDTSKKQNSRGLLEQHIPVRFRPNPETRVRPIVKRSNPCFRVWS